MKQKRQQRMVLLICCIAVGLTLISLSIILLVSRTDSAKDTDAEIQTELNPTERPTLPSSAPEQRIGGGVTVSGVSVAGLTREEAVELLQSQISNPYADKEVVIHVDGEAFHLTAEAADVHWDVEKAVSTALRGVEGDISLELTMDSDRVMRSLQAFFEPLGGVYIPSGYWVEGEMPDIEQLAEPCQTLVLNTGCPGYLIDLQDICEQVLASFQDESNQITIDSLGERKEPQALKLDQIFNQVSILPVNPRVDPESLQVIPGQKGYGFDREKAASLLESARAGDTLRLQMEYLEPTVSEEDAWFQDTLGYCKTEYTDNENRNENLRLACSKLNGLILQPGETLSYNEVLGKRTTEAGYKPAPAYSGTELVDEVGGGICQVSSTLYLSSLFAELHIVERRNHGYPASYIPLGLDATVNWGTTDLKIRNDYDLPVKILAEASDGYVKVRIMGVERRDYYVKMEYRVDDHPDYAAAFLCRYDRETDEQIYRVLDHTSIYLEDVWCNPGYAESATDDP